MSEVDPQSFPRVPGAVFDDAQFLRKYELERELGIGGAGVVVCARHRELDERVAIKFLHSGSESAEAVARFRREARAAHRVRNQHVVGIVDVSTTETGVPYVVMEYLEGTDLERMLLETPDGQLPVRDAIEFVLQACEALAECHAIGIVHRDLKPSNLFCTHGADGLPIIKVLDFGISKLGTVTIDEAMTARNAIMGSPRYMSPEQFATPVDVDRRADIWGLGIILYELVTGKAPFVGNTLIGIWERVKKDVPQPIEELRRDAPRALGPIVQRCLEKERDQRYQSVADLAKALLPLASERMRATVARIVRIVEAPGGTTASLSLPPSGRAPTDGATSVSVPAASVSQHNSKNLRIALVVAAAAIGVVWAVTRKVTAPSTSEVSQAQHPPAATPPLRPAPSVAGAVAPPALPASSLAVAPVGPVMEGQAPPPAASATSATPSAPRARPNATRSGAEALPVPTPNATAAAAPASAPPASSASAAPPSTVSAAAPAVTAPVEIRTGKSATAPWVMDIVEQRKGKTGGSP